MKLNALLATVAAACLAGPLAAQELIYSSHTPDTYPDNAYTATRMFERITEATGGARTIRIAGGGVLAKGSAALSSVTSGAVDTAMLVYNYTPSDIPVLNLLGDLYSTDARVAGAATSETLLLDCPECKEEMDKHNIVVLFNTSSPPYNLLCTDDRVESLADLAGLKVRAVGSFGPLAQHIGATPVNIPYDEVYEALQRGQIDCGMLDASQVSALQLDFLKYVTEVPLGTFQSIGFIAVNKDIWNGFSDEEKAIWIDSAGEAVRDFEFEFTGRVAAAEAKATEEYGTEFVTPAEDLVAAVAEYRASEKPALIERAKERGVKDPEAMIAAFEENTAKWQKIVDEIGTGEWGDAEWDAYAARVKEEIFSKVEM
ncbi:MAG: C4-dicarboxylate TRAP transporter substrate-binding protein [Vannielia sp.]|uniref:C4-dicarboxylate TRAP transporter substrate-binding protein n=1 Tax=Vannielia sp. TaxID=2813045 RepID=UPI003B8D1CDB